MGKKKSASTNLGKSIIRSRFGKNVNKSGDSFLHTSEISDGYDWGRLNLQSVTEQSNLDDFLATAELAGTEFTAEKLNISFVEQSKNSGVLSRSQLNDISAAQDKHRSLLQIPRRPAWDETTTPEELDSRERTAFLDWRRGLSQLQEVKDIHLTPYEKNLDFWRQLWRVIERSDVIVQIVDARNPLLFRCVDLEKYVNEVSPDKVNVVLINKADYLSETQRKLWGEYFDGEGVRVAFWSALEETKKQEMITGDDADGDDDDDGSDDDDSDMSHDDLEGSGVNETDSINHDEQGPSDELVLSKGDNCDLLTQSNPPCSPMETVTKSDYSETESDSKCQTVNPSLKDEVKMNTETEPSTVDSRTCGFKNNSDLLNGEELLELFRTINTENKVNENHTTIGMVGYPNVGKSSTINAILQMKKVPVSATPGRTKHFQTLFVDSDLMLCDCPGLVFPSFVTTKAELVVNGVLPIDRMRDHVPPVSLICQRIPRRILERTYGVNLPMPGESEDPNRPPTTEEFLNAHGYMRGYMTSRGMPDNPRSSRYILKDYVNGKLLFCNPPPGVNSDDFQPTWEQPIKHEENKDNQSEPKKPVQIPSQLDTEFFKKADPKVRSKGVHGVTGFARTNAMGEHIPSSSGAADTGSTQSLSGKPWKKHNNRNKKEKARRIHGGLDN